MIQSEPSAPSHLLGQRRTGTGESRKSSFDSGLTSTTTKVGASRFPKSTARSQQGVIGNVSSRDSTSSGIKKGKSPSRSFDA
ncbi:hypothetical protein MTO96_030477 [Rhipicephalus appendiculatus]